MRRLFPRHSMRYRTITADNGCEFHGYRDLEKAHDLKFDFAPPMKSPDEVLVFHFTLDAEGLK